MKSRTPADWPCVSWLSVSCHVTPESGPVQLFTLSYFWHDEIPHPWHEFRLRFGGSGFAVFRGHPHSAAPNPQPIPEVQRVLVLVHTFVYNSADSSRTRHHVIPPDETVCGESQCNQCGSRVTVTSPSVLITGLSFPRLSCPARPLKPLQTCGNL